MSQIRRIQIENFRCIESFDWFPSAGINCLIGPGDSGKSTILDAIDLCLGVRRSSQFGSAQFRDSDFFKMDVSKKIQVSLTLGALDDSLKNLDQYGFYLRGFDSKRKEIHDEPKTGCETVLTLRLVVMEDLDPDWSLFSERAAARGESKHLQWSDRMRLTSTRLTGTGEHHLSWRRGSLLHKLTGERAAVSAELTRVARDARKTFGATAKDKVAETLKLVENAAVTLGISTGEVSALLDSNSISFFGGTISLHNADGVPLRELGLGSTRLLITQLQRKVANTSEIILVDEVEHGLEPHRIIRLIDTLGAKEPVPPLQVFMTTHSPIALRELEAKHLNVLRCSTDGVHEVRNVGDFDVQGTVRACPEAFLAPSVVVCEGATEVGFLRGLNHFYRDTRIPFAARGVAIVDGGGDSAYRRAIDLVKLGYRTLLLRDNDKPAKPKDVTQFRNAGGTLIEWRSRRALEEELFQSLSDAAVSHLLDEAIEIKGIQSVQDQIHATSEGTCTLRKCQAGVTPSTREHLGQAAKKGNWFKTVSTMANVTNKVVARDLELCEKGFAEIVDRFFVWTDASPN